MYHKIYSDSSSLTIEEDNRYVELEIKRSFGTFGSIMVTLNTVEGSAISPSGELLSLALNFIDYENHASNVHKLL